MKSNGKEKEEKGREWELTGDLAKRIQVGNLCSIRDLFTDSWSWQSFVSCFDVFTCHFALDLQNVIQLLSTFFCYSWLACLLVCGWEMRLSGDKKKSEIIVFKNKLLLVSLLHLAGLCEKSYLMGFRAASRPVSLMCFFSCFMFMPSFYAHL